MHLVRFSKRHFLGLIFIIFLFFQNCGQSFQGQIVSSSEEEISQVVPRLDDDFEDAPLENPSNETEITTPETSVDDNSNSIETPAEQVTFPPNTDYFPATAEFKFTRGSLLRLNIPFRQLVNEDVNFRFQLLNVESQDFYRLRDYFQESLQINQSWAVTTLSGSSSVQLTLPTNQNRFFSPALLTIVMTNDFNDQTTQLHVSIEPQASDIVFALEGDSYNNPCILLAYNGMAYATTEGNTRCSQFEGDLSRFRLLNQHPQSKISLVSRAQGGVATIYAESYPDGNQEIVILEAKPDKTYARHASRVDQPLRDLRGHYNRVFAIAEDGQTLYHKSFWSGNYGGPIITLVTNKRNLRKIQCTGGDEFLMVDNENRVTAYSVRSGQLNELQQLNITGEPLDLFQGHDYVGVVTNNQAYILSRLNFSQPPGFFSVNQQNKTIVKITGSHSYLILSYDDFTHDTYSINPFGIGPNNLALDNGNGSNETSSYRGTYSTRSLAFRIGLFFNPTVLSFNRVNALQAPSE